MISSSIIKQFSNKLFILKSRGVVFEIQNLSEANFKLCQNTDHVSNVIYTDVCVSLNINNCKVIWPSFFKSCHNNRHNNQINQALYFDNISHNFFLKQIKDLFVGRVSNNGQFSQNTNLVTLNAIELGKAWQLFSQLKQSYFDWDNFPENKLMINTSDCSVVRLRKRRKEWVGRYIWWNHFNVPLNQKSPKETFHSRPDRNFGANLGWGWRLFLEKDFHMILSHMNRVINNSLSYWEKY